MSLFTAKSLLESARIVALANSRQGYVRASRSILLEASNQAAEDESFDIFLSHSSLDTDLVLGLKTQIETMGYSIYVDFVTDNQMERSEASKETAKLLKQRMENSRCLFFATSSNSSISKWMPWECGFFDGKKPNKVAICPISMIGTAYSYHGQEYLALYPYVSKESPQGQSDEVLWINETSSKYERFDNWLLGHQPYERQR